MYDWQRVVRTLQTYFPAFVDLKYRAQHAKRGLLRQPFERDFEVLAHFHPEPTADFVDVGANRGQTVQAIRLFNTVNPITCFEPSAHAFRELVRYTAGVGDVSLRDVGLGNDKGELTLYTPAYRGYVFDGLSSVVESEAAEWLTDRLVAFDPRKLEVLSQLVRIETLDQQRLRPAFVKVDVQGAEPAVLEGGRATLTTHKPIVLLEAPQPDRETALLAGCGYEAYSYDGGRLRRGAGDTVNVFFVHPDRRGEISSQIIDR